MFRLQGQCDKACYKLGIREAFSTSLCCSVSCRYRQSSRRMTETEGENHKQYVPFPGSTSKGGSLLLASSCIESKEGKGLQWFYCDSWNRCFTFSIHRETSEYVNTDYPREFCQVTSANSCPRWESKSLHLPESCEQLKPVSPVLLLFPNVRPPAMRAVRWGDSPKSAKEFHSHYSVDG